MDGGSGFVTKGVEGDEIVITGMSGRFPESENLQELWDNLLSKTDMIKVDGECLERVRFLSLVVG